MTAGAVIFAAVGSLVFGLAFWVWALIMVGGLGVLAYIVTRHPETSNHTLRENRGPTLEQAERLNHLFDDDQA